jgi:Carboxypeptidase regulatory-like domain
MNIRACWIILLTALAALAAPLDAQVVRGRLLESGSGRPIILGRVLLLDTTYASVAETITDEQGRFVVEAPVPGDYWIAADRLGYRPVIDGILELGVGGLLPADVYMRPEALVLEGSRSRPSGAGLSAP